MRAPRTRHPLAIVGALIATASATVFVTMIIAGLAGMFNNPYAGLVVFIAIPALFVMGLLLIPAGAWLERKRLQRDPNAVAADWPVLDFRRPEIRRNALLITLLTAVNVMIVLLAGYGGLHWMESPGFCGQVCHTPMQPQFAAWEDATHARIACAACHIGEGAAGFVHAKLSGVRQLVHVATSSYPRPIPSGADLPAGVLTQTCSSCHLPNRAGGDRVKVLREYADDEQNSETVTVLQMHVNMTSPGGKAIHWHADPANRVEFVATDADRQTIPYVRVTNAQGVKEYVAPDTPEEVIRTGTLRLMECGDCHNAVGHPIAPTAEKAVDQAIAASRVSRNLPFVRREGLKLLKTAYPSHEVAANAIDEGLRGFYKSQGSAPDEQMVTQTVAALQNLYRRNVFPTMSVTWGTYPNNSGHFTSNGCFRCHDESHTAKDGSTISADCESCHTQK